ncbi:hypothetical protein [Pediococcus argentinicus]|uniref:Uncharacterized protein n=1 Tax=Pediococcus argentinicus TaxID=480391 RepID=A0A0R2N4M4_9LACO|nr:hypothetical protein [Pediococcus argentinicus]KRO20564.1 hypothetical protein IV88_GL001577 [Pediococcus argentinicus]NKZ22892.1 hypothetical protein [Pediococcus argentinicus]GEP20386.1 hypothetical protein LSA03_17700 [Pediococcus argentinicus]
MDNSLKSNLIKYIGSTSILNGGILSLINGNSNWRLVNGYYGDWVQELGKINTADWRSDLDTNKLNLNSLLNKQLDKLYSHKTSTLDKQRREKEKELIGQVILTSSTAAGAVLGLYEIFKNRKRLSSMIKKTTKSFFRNIVRTGKKAYHYLSGVAHKVTKKAKRVVRNVKKFVSKTYRHVKHPVKRGYRRAKKFAHRVYRRTRRVFQHVYHRVRRVARRIYRRVRSVYRRPIHYVRRVYYRARRVVRSVYRRPIRFVRRVYYHARRVVRHVYHRARSIFHKVRHTFSRAVHRIGRTIRHWFYF